MDFNKFIKSDTNDHTYKVNAVPMDDGPAQSGKKKSSKKKTTSTEVAIVNSNPPVAETSMSYLSANIPYAQAYIDTNKQLDESIAQLNMLGGELMGDLNAVRASKTLRNKYNYINDMTETATSIISSKIAAIKEKNKTINDINHLELTRMKELKSQANAEDDNARIANMYDAFVSTPVGIGGSPMSVLGPNMQDIMMPSMGQGFDRGVIGGTDQASWEASLDPAQARMVLEAKGAIETVVMYDETSGNRWFEVVDKNTRQPIQGVEKPDPTFIYDLDINLRGGFAKDSNRNVVYPLVVISGQDQSIMNY